ncbi:hypothetical protein V6N11_035739 [Hibiscus sabdariffa]|uniref:Reverse transcriptase zinc-binding domain-containing protein n=1 Tax=Hibiscus sabdariffa TaxID=183260 RepID=A0ABR2R8C3_9ROSI
MRRVFRAKYFRLGNLLDAGLPDHASYVWKGLYYALQDLRGGFLPLSDSHPTQYRWSGRDTGIFSVRSGYFYLCRSSSSYCRPSPLWKALKSLPTLPEVRIFAWRLAHDCLPTGSRVAAAGLGPGVYPFCSTTWKLLCMHFRTALLLLRPCILEAFLYQLLTVVPTLFLAGWLTLLDLSLGRIFPSLCLFFGTGGTFGFMTPDYSRFGLWSRQLPYYTVISLLLMITGSIRDPGRFSPLLLGLPPFWDYCYLC